MTNGTKEAIRLWGLKKLILRNNDKSSETHYRLIVINHILTQVSHNDFNNKIYLERKKCITSITSSNVQNNKVSGKEDLFNALV